MNDDLDSRDELASAHLDGLTTPEEEARIAADPDLQRRVEALDHVRRLVADAPEPPSDRQRDEAVTAALRAIGQQRPADTSPGAEVRQLPRRREGLVLRVVAAAAVVLVMLALIPALTGDQGGEDTAAEAPAATEEARAESLESADEDRATTTAPALGPEAAPLTSDPQLDAGAGDEARPDGAEEGEDAPDADLASDVVDLGSAADLDELVAEVDRRLLTPSLPATGSGPPDDGTGFTAGLVDCLTELAEDDPAAVRLRAVALLEGRQVAVVVVGDRVLVATTATVPTEPTCTGLAEVELAE